VECDEASTFEADPLTDEDIQAEFNHSADANEEEEEEMDEDEIVIVDEPPKPPTQCELRHAIGVTCAKVRSPQKYQEHFSNHSPEFLGCKEATSYYKLFQLN